MFSRPNLASPKREGEGAVLAGRVGGADVVRGGGAGGAAGVPAGSRYTRPYVLWKEP